MKHYILIIKILKAEYFVCVPADEKQQQQSSSDGNPAKKNSRTSISEQKGAPSDSKGDKICLLFNIFLNIISSSTKEKNNNNRFVSAHFTMISF